MKKLVLNDNKFDNEGGAALLECLRNIEELLMMRCQISPEIEAKMEERASENNVQLELRFDYHSWLNGLLEQD